MLLPVYNEKVFINDFFSEVNQYKKIQNMYCKSQRNSLKVKLKEKKKSENSSYLVIFFIKTRLSEIRNQL